jgi:hypothetical protein
LTTTWNPSDLTAVTLSGGNLIATATSSTSGVRGVDRVYSGKYYWEYTIGTIGGANTGFGVAQVTAPFSTLGANATGAALLFKSGNLWVNGASVLTGATAALVAGNVVCVALDLDNRLIFFRIGAAGNWNGNASYSPATGAGGVSVPIVGGAFGAYPAWSGGATNDACTANFGGSAFVGTPPSGYTSGFPSGTTTIGNSMVVTQAALEQWAPIVPPQMRVTQVAIEQWGSVAIGMVPGKLDDGELFYAPTVSAAASLSSLLPGLVTDTDIAYLPTIVGGAVGLGPSLVLDTDSVLAPTLAADAPTLLPGLITDPDTIFAPTATSAGAARTLLPGLYTDSETIFAPAITGPAARTLRPGLVVDTEAVYPAYSIDTAKPPKEQTLRASKASDFFDDAVFPARLSLSPSRVLDNDVIFAPISYGVYPLAPPFLASDDSFKTPFVALQATLALVVDTEIVYRPLITLFAQPQSVVDIETIPPADVGWQVIATFTADGDTLFVPVNAFAYNDILPDIWLDEENIEGYPFRVQSITGGVPVPPPLGGLTGSTNRPRQLHGSTGQRQLTGSLKSKRTLTGSLRNVK